MQAYVPKIISAVVGLALLGVGAWLLVAGQPDTGGTLLTAALLVLGAVGTVALPALHQPGKPPSDLARKRAERMHPYRDVPPSDGALALALVVIAAACAAASGCSAGPQLPVTTVPVTITCSWTAAPDGGALSDNDCMVDRSSAGADPRTTGNDLRGTTVSPDVRTNVSATGGTGTP